jgi:hypothetical protein
MVRSSHGQRPATTWAVAQKPKPMPRIVRLGRPANDNFRRPRLLLRMFVVALAAVLAVLAAANLNLI